MKVAFQGARGAFSHRATQLFSQQMNLDDTTIPVSCRTFGEVFDKVISREADFAAIPLENSSVGSIIPNYDLLSSRAVAIVSEVYVPVQHNVIGIAGSSIETVKEIYSHPVALDQCRDFFESMPSLLAVAYWDTGGAAAHVQETNSLEIAAIAGSFAAIEYGLRIIKRNVEDHPGNRTRFGIITCATAQKGAVGLNETATELIKRLERYKMSCAVELAHEPGSLAKLLGALAECGANLTKIDSRPIPERPWHYRFFLDMQITKQSDAAVLNKLSQFTIETKMLGRYPIWEKPD